jgi:hypothetical protein
MSLASNGCHGGVVLEWSAVADAAFHRYITLRSTAATIPAAYPPQAGAVELPWTKSKDPGVTSAPDTSATPGTTFSYRTLALNAANQVIAASGVGSATASPPQGLGALAAISPEPGKTKFAWATYGGSPVCFTWYKLVYSETNPAPSYLGGDPAWAVISDQATDRAVVEGLVPGTTYYVRLQAIRSTALGAFVVAESEVLTYIAP